jgi:hypothetical protein
MEALGGNAESSGFYSNGAISPVNDEVRGWTDAALANDEFVVSISDRAVQASWSQGLGLAGLGDAVARRREYVHLEPLATILDVGRFRERIRQLAAYADLPPQQRERIERFLATPEENPDRIRRAE